MKSKLEIYALAVCFSAVICLVISAGVAGYSVFEIAIPEVTMNSRDYDNHQSNDAYWENNQRYTDEAKKEVRPNEEELTKKRLAAFTVEVNSEKRRGLQSLIRCLMFLLVGGVTLITHWKIAKSARVA